MAAEAFRRRGREAAVHEFHDAGLKKDVDGGPSPAMTKTAARRYSKRLFIHGPW
jgi:hypothetical protein